MCGLDEPEKSLDWEWSLVSDTRPREGVFTSGIVVASALVREGMWREVPDLHPDALILNAVQVKQAAGKSSWAKDQGLMRDLKTAHWNLGLSWNLRIEGKGRRSKSCWGHLLSGLNLWMAMGK